MANFNQKDETYTILGACMEVHNILGKGFSEIVYKDALQVEFNERRIPFNREQKFEVNYKGVILPHYFSADFVCYGNIILEIKGTNAMLEQYYKQTLNYMAIAKSSIGLLVNFGGESLRYKRLVL